MLEQPTKSDPIELVLDTLLQSFNDDTPEEFKGVIRHCVCLNPAERPSAKAVQSLVFKANPDRHVDIMDKVLRMMEVYANQLEDIVAQRTEELRIERENLEVERQKLDTLVCKMLPKKIAERLKLGEHVEPEHFDCVTIYFSDIVGFTTIAGRSSAFEIVSLLNDLYSMFDEVLDQFDVYKVETIGDAYMVASGLPERNGDKHAGEISSMALHLLSATCSFKIRHLPEETLQLRCGIHSGPVAAGVVGLTMPRYCLFGDTVNTASRMESSGFALQVHMSSSTAKMLMKLNAGYQLRERGTIQVKGKGEMVTYFLVGLTGFDLELPDLEKAASMSQHEFK